MADAVLLSAGLSNAQACVDLAVEHGLGIEVMAFAYPNTLDGDWRAKVAAYQAMLRPVSGVITLHGPFMDMAVGSPDVQIERVVKGRFRHALEIARDLGARLVVLHANHIPNIRNEEYRSGWQRRNVDFWADIAVTAQRVGVLAAVENMWEYDPYIIGDVLKTLNSPYIRACLDVGHTHLYSEVPFDEWLTVMAPYLAHVHLNNNDGIDDNHRSLNQGVVGYDTVLPRLRALPTPPTMTLEMDQVADMLMSLPYFSIEPQVQRD
ncbi:MAG: sugar phosphate isomerase/epimerase family protein [Chloroflexota bacterium]|nr:sugar phosphate isomerase/epimerase family protein [Chloroflexota bacterium]